MKTVVRLLLLASFLLSACGPALVVTPTPTPIGVQPVLIDAPYIVAQTPTEGERLALEPIVELTFDRDMDKARTESAFSFDASSGDPVRVTVSWPNARTLRFTPDDALAPATTYIVTVSADARGADGKAPVEDIRLEFRTIEPLAVGQIFPANDAVEVDLDSTITVIFNQPVVPTTIVEEQTELPQPLVIKPEVKGTGEWVSSSVYVFQPENLLGSGTRYEVQVEAGLAGVSGLALEQPFTWTFVTRAPGIDTLSLKGGETNPAMDISNVLLDQAFIISFLQPMDETSTNAAVTLTDRDSKAVFPTELTWNDDFTALTIAPVGRYRISGRYQLDITTAALAQDMSPLKEGLTFRFTTLPLPRVVSVLPLNNSKEKYFNSWATIRFSSPMEFDTLKDRVVVTPAPKKPVSFYYNQYSWEYNIIGLEPSTDYTIRLLPGAADIYGNRIEKEYSWSFRTGEMYPVAQLVVPDTPIYRAQGEQTFFFQYTNLDSVEIKLYPLSADEFLRIQRGAVSVFDISPRAAPIRTWKPDLTVDPNERQRVEYELKDAFGNPLPPGYYFLGVNAEPFDYTSKFLQGAALVVATDNLTLKTTPTEALVWVTDLETGKPTPGVTALFYDNEGRFLGRATSDRNGIAMISGVKEPTFARTDDPSRLAFAAKYWGSGVSAGNFGIYQDYWTVPNQPFAFVFTERPIYRPGQDVFIKGILRQNDDLHYSLPTQTEVYVIVSFEGETVYEKTLALNEFGSFADVFHIGEEASLGSYDIIVKLRKEAEVAYGYHSFRVAEYRKPEFQAIVTPNVPDVLAGDKFNFALDASYYSGGVVGGADVSWFLTAFPMDFRPLPAFSSFSFSDYDYDKYGFVPWNVSTTLDEGEAVLDANGHLELSQVADLGKYANGAMVTLSCNVTDVAGNLVSGSASVHVHPSLIYAGIRSQSYVGIENLPQTFDLVVLDWESNPVADQPVTVEIVRREWFSVQEEDDQGTLRWVTTVKDTPIVTLDAVTDADGLANVSFTPTSGGVYKATVRVQDEKGNQQQSSQFIWVAGAEYIPWQQTNDRSFKLVADKDSYSVGDTAKILIAQPFEGEHYALITYERGHIYEQKVILLKGNSTIYELPITKDMAPVAYVSVVVIKGAEDGTTPDFKIGMIRLQVDLSQQRLDVSVTTDKDSAGPRDKVTYTVTVKDYAGNPAQAELSLALVDKAVLALAPPNSPPMLDAFYPERALSVFTSLGIVMSADAFNERYRQAVEDGFGGGSGGGGKGEGALGIVTVRQDFRDTAYYEAQVKTDANGRAV
ncbi:MAG: Ig-like domain-containing protein, partial [Chloroflexota bacterium]